MKINRNSGAEQPNPLPQQPTPVRRAPKAAPVRQETYDDTEPYEEDDEDDEDERPRRRFPFGCLIVLLMLALVAFGGYKVYQFYGEVDGSGNLGKEQSVSIQKGASLADVSATLKEDGIIEYDWLFKLYAKYSGNAGGLQYGKFTLRSGMSYNDIITTLSEVQRRKTVDITIPEGTTAVGIAKIFVNAGLVPDVDTFLNCANGTDGSDFSQYDFWNNIPDNGRLMKCEGYLYPDTYNVFADEDVYYYVDTLYAEFASKTSQLATELSSKGVTLDDVVILASFIQEEAGIASEDAKVSACFHNRMESTDPQWSSHRLESNASSYFMYDTENNYLWNSPTAEYYGWPAAGAIPEDVLNKYDTYRVSGLPAGPLSSPGFDCLNAALNPDQQFIDEGYYFFVTGNPSGDYPGQFFYARTDAEHEANCVKAGWR